MCRLGTLILLTGVLAVFSAEAKQSENKCPSYDTLDKITYLPYSSDCSRFVRCVNGKPVLGRCPAGLEFSAANSSCEPPSVASCKPQIEPCTSGSPQSTCEYTCRCSAEHDDVPCPASVKFSADMELFDTSLREGCQHTSSEIPVNHESVGRLRIKRNSSDVSYCPDNSSRGVGNIPHFADCSKVIRCANGKDHVYYCPVGLFFNPTVQFCDEPEFSGCNETNNATSAEECPPEDARAKCGQSCECSVVQGSCPASVAFNASFRGYDTTRYPGCKNESMIVNLGGDYVGILEVNSSSVRADVCSGQRTVMPHPTDCGKLIACTNNKERTLACPVGLHFNPTKKVCDDPTSAGCNTTETDSPVTGIDCPSETTCPATGESIPHVTDCTLFCNCEGGKAKLDACPPGLHFDRQRKVCDYPATSNCQSKCPKLDEKEGVSWTPASCVQGDSGVGATCNIQCDADYELTGSAQLTCTDKGWHGTGGLYNIPSCKTPGDIGKDLMDKINETLHEVIGESKAAMMFVMDESGSVGTTDYEIEKNFASSLVKGFPLSSNRTAGVITFSNMADVDIGLTENSTCKFIDRLEKVKYNGGATDIKQALELCRSEMLTEAKDRQTLVFLITDGISDTDPSDAARLIRDSNGTLFTIGVAHYERKQLEPIASVYRDGSPLFFGISSFEVFRVVADYLNTVYSKGSPTCA